MLWLKVGKSNNDPYVVAHYYLYCVETLKGIMLYRYSTIHAIDCYDSGTPRILRCDMGTENSNIDFIQPFLRRYGTDCFAGDSSFRYGRSVSKILHELFYVLYNIIVYYPF